MWEEFDKINNWEKNLNTELFNLMEYGIKVENWLIQFIHQPIPICLSRQNKIIYFQMWYNKIINELMNVLNDVWEKIEKYIYYIVRRKNL